MYGRHAHILRNIYGFALLLLMLHLSIAFCRAQSDMRAHAEASLVVNVSAERRGLARGQVHSNMRRRKARDARRTRGRREFLKTPLGIPHTG